MPAIMLSRVEHESDCPKPLGAMSYETTDTFADFRVKLESGQMFDFPFSFMDPLVGTRMIPSFERFNKLIDFGGKVTVIPTQSVVTRPLMPRVEHRMGLVQLSSDEDCGNGVHISSAASNSPCDTDCNVVEPSSEPSEQVSQPHSINLSMDPGPIDQPVASDPYKDFRSLLMPTELQRVWDRSVSKLKDYMKLHKMEDHHWLVRTLDKNGALEGNIECLECHAQVDGSSKGRMTMQTIHNAFNNFKSKHLYSNKHQERYLRNRKLPDTETEVLSRIQASKPSDKTILDHHLTILEKIEAEDPSEEKIFSVIGDVDKHPLILFSFRVRCNYCRDDMALVPQQRNLEHNIRYHLASPRHQANVKSMGETPSSEPLRTGRPGRPPIKDKRDVKQRTIGAFFNSDGNQPSSSSSKSDKGKGTELQLDSHSLLCWGLWREVVEWNGHTRTIKEILQDQLRGKDWYPEPFVVAQVYCLESKQFCKINDLFRHINCSRISEMGGGFIDLTCESCWGIKTHTDFRLRLYREDQAIEKRGTRDTSGGRRLGYLTHVEVRNQARKYQAWGIIERHKTRRLQHRICMLQAKVPTLRSELGEALNRKDVLRFCNVVILAHKKGAFGGRQALSDLLKDTVMNLNRGSAGKRYSDGTKLICQALYQHGGRRVVDCLATNLIGPSLSTLQRARKGMSIFQAGIHEEQFHFVGKVYKNIKDRLGIVGDVPCSLAEDETCVKRTVRWLPKSDSLLGFCGTKDNHICESGLEIEVGDRKVGFDKIITSFENYVVGNQARVIIVNPLHPSFPRLCIMATCTCNHFDSAWVRNQWDLLVGLWNSICRQPIGPLIGHAYDGDPRRRKLMLEDFTGRGINAPRYDIGWAGWQLSYSLIGEKSTPYGLHDQDYIHNAKKMINPLDSTAKVLKLGSSVAIISHLILVYDLYSHGEHMLNHEDILRTDRQNWASAQRLCNRSAIFCLKMMQTRGDARVEMTVGSEIYLSICADYIDIFLNTRLSLRQRVILCGKVSFFLRLWRLWVIHGNHSVGGNRQQVTMKNMISMQTFLDMQMSLHFVVHLIGFFRDNYPYLEVPLHLTGSDSCEQFFSKVGGMKGHERSYDFAELVDCATSLNRLAEMEMMDGLCGTGRSHKKHSNIWMKLHPLLQGETNASQKDFIGLESQHDVTFALKEGFKLAQDLAIILQMCPSTSCKDREWFDTPWTKEAEGPKAGQSCDIQCDNLEAADDELVDGFSMQSEPIQTPSCSMPTSNVQEGSSSEPWSGPLDIEVDGVEDTMIASEEVQTCMIDMFHDLTTSLTYGSTVKVVDPLVEFEGRHIYKSTLVAQLVGNPTLSKDRLTRVKQSIYFNNLVDKPMNREGAMTMYMGIGSDCGVFFEAEQAKVDRPMRKREQQVNNKNLSAQVSRSLKVIKSGKGRPVGVHTLPTAPRYVWWIGRIQNIRKKYGAKMGRSREPVDLLNRPGRLDSSTEAVCEVMLNWFTPLNKNTRSKGTHKFKYSLCDPQWIDLDCVISTVTMSVQPKKPDIFILNENDAMLLDGFVSNKV